MQKPLLEWFLLSYYGSQVKARDILRVAALKEKGEELARQSEAIEKERSASSKKKGVQVQRKSGRDKRIPYRTQLRAQAASGVNRTNEDAPLRMEIVVKGK